MLELPSIEIILQNLCGKYQYIAACSSQKKFSVRDAVNSDKLKPKKRVAARSAATRFLGATSLKADSSANQLLVMYFHVGELIS